MTPPECIFVDFRCQGVASSPAQSVGHLIVYGVEGKQNDVDSAVYDALYVVDKGKMVMQTDLALNTHHIRGLSVDENDKTSAVSIAYLEDGVPKKYVIKFITTCLYPLSISACQTPTPDR